MPSASSAVLRCYIQGFLALPCLVSTTKSSIGSLNTVDGGSTGIFQVSTVQYLPGFTEPGAFPIQINLVGAVISVLLSVCNHPHRLFPGIGRKKGTSDSDFPELLPGRAYIHIAATPGRRSLQHSVDR